LPHPLQSTFIPEGCTLAFSRDMGSRFMLNLHGNSCNPAPAGPSTEGARASTSAKSKSLGMFSDRWDLLDSETALDERDAADADFGVGVDNTASGLGALSKT